MRFKALPPRQFPRGLPKLYSGVPRESRTSPITMNVQQALEAGQDDVVTVNQRALIDKILARYPGEFTGGSRCSASARYPLDDHLFQFFVNYSR